MIELNNSIALPKPEIITLQVSRETVESEISQLESEKDEIEETLPLLIAMLTRKHSAVETSLQEKEIYEQAIRDLETAYPFILGGGLAAGALLPERKDSNENDDDEEYEGEEGEENW
jgi:hypothetical protein